MITLRYDYTQESEVGEVRSVSQGSKVGKSGEWVRFVGEMTSVSRGKMRSVGRGSEVSKYRK